MNNSIEHQLTNKLINTDDIAIVINEVLEDSELSNLIIKRTLVEQYITNFYNKFNHKRIYYKKYILEINEQIKNSYLIGKNAHEIYNLISKSNEKIEAILFETSSYNKSTDHKNLVTQYINFIITNLNDKDRILRTNILNNINENIDNSNRHLNIDEKKELVKNAIIKLEEKNIDINYTTLSKQTNKHPRTIKKYLKQLKIRF